MNQADFYTGSELEDELKIDVKKILYTLWNRKNLAITTFLIVLAFFILMTFISAKKYTVTADLYINKANSTNMAEFNPYVLGEMTQGGGLSAMMQGNGNALKNEIELLKSPLVIDKVIRDNNLVFRKKWGIIPNKREGEYIPASAFTGSKKIFSVENKNGTNILTISYTSRKPKVSYNIVNSIITHYIELHKDLNSEKSASDITILENEYNQIKAQLDKKIKKMNALPQNAMNGAGQLSAVSAFSIPAQKAISSLKSQYASSEKSILEMQEDSAKVAELAKKLEWAKLVKEMSGTSKVIVLKEPEKLRDFEYSSPRLVKNIIIGIILGFISAFISIIIAELTDKKLTFSAIDGNIIYNIKEDINNLKLLLLAEKDSKISFVSFIENDMLKEQLNIKADIIKADISEEFDKAIKNTDKIVLVEKIAQTDVKLYRQIKTFLEKTGKPVIAEILM